MTRLLTLGAGGGDDAFLPDQIAGLMLWLKADAITGLNDGDPVTTWEDSSAQGNDVTQATAANKPLYKTSIINGKPIVRFDGTNDILTSAGLPTNSANYSYFIVYKRTGAGVSQTPFVNGSSGGFYLELDGTNQRDNAHAGVADQTDGASPTTFEIISVTRTATGPLTSMWVDGSSVVLSPNNAGFIAPTGVCAVGGRVALINFFNGDIAEVILYNSELSTADRDIVESYLGTKYDIAVS